MTTYTRSRSSDFGGLLDIAQFDDEIRDSGDITKNLLGINVTGDVIEIVFDGELSIPEEMDLNTLITNHVPEEYTGYNVMNISVPKNFITLSDYTTLTVFNFPGTNKLSIVTHIKIISEMEDEGISYEIRLCDITNNTKICSKILNNVEEYITDLGTINNLPKKESIFELQARVVGETVAHINNINIYYD